MSAFTQEERIRLHVEDELLKFVDESHQMTRSDLQGRAHPVAQGIIEWMRKEPAENAVEGQHEYQNAFDELAGHPMDKLNTLTAREGRNGCE